MHGLWLGFVILVGSAAVGCTKEHRRGDGDAGGGGGGDGGGAVLDGGGGGGTAVDGGGGTPVDGGAAVDIRGDSPEEAAEEVATAVCDWSARCGEPNVECSGGSDGGLMCTGTIEDVDWSTCYAETHAEVLADFRCVDLTTEQRVQVNDCINGLASSDCVTMAELQEYLDRLEAGEEPPFPFEPPAECETLDDLFDACPDA